MRHCLGPRFLPLSYCAKSRRSEKREKTQFDRQLLNEQEIICPKEEKIKYKNFVRRGDEKMTSEEVKMRRFHEMN